MNSILLATTRRVDFPDLVDETDGAVRALDALGLRSTPAAWHDEGIDWSTSAVVLIRTTWDYPEFIDDFCVWLDHLDTHDAVVINPTTVIRWNLRKTYLIDLEQRGVEIVPVEFAPAGTEVRAGAARLVTKPVIGVGSNGARLLEPRERYKVESDSLVSPFQERIMEGELSVFIVDGAPVHTIRKLPSVTDWRVQPQWGGRYTSEEHPPEGAMAAALHAFEVIEARFADGSGLCFLRVDLVQSDRGTWRVLEVEAIEPSFYTAQTPAIVDAVARSVRRRLAAG